MYKVIKYVGHRIYELEGLKDKFNLKVARKDILKINLEDRCFEETGANLNNREVLRSDKSQIIIRFVPCNL